VANARIVGTFARLNVGTSGERPDVASGELTKSGGERGRRTGLKPGLYKGEEGFLAALEMTESNRGKGGRPPADALFYCRSNTRRFGSVRPAAWMAIVKVLPTIGEVNSPLLSTYAILSHYQCFP
jgi:hypothetical protein